ncbi:hypothetical protein [Eubacterium sp.]|uniref:hypothetical protein n=1 Tax=Eubacterium sp. TaxID=142586 RepID=UPI001DC356AE|nr:hypothetical protein [Eubacterium sp.]MBS5620723.1 hypothetical protein [Eubacterium sp.]
MEKIEIRIERNVDISEFKKCISFVSQAIIKYSIKKNVLVVYISKKEEKENITKKLVVLMKKYKKIEDISECYFQNSIEKEKYYDLKNSTQDVMFWGNGQISFSGKGKFILEYFDNLFCNIACGLGSSEKLYPTLLPIDGYYRTGYVKKTPQYAIFCSSVKENLEMLEETNERIKFCNINEILKEPQYALSPSACFHAYIEYENRILEDDTIITFKQNVFRNEGRLNYDELGRLCDYQVREIVMIGSQEYVEKCRSQIMKKTVDIMKEYGMKGNITLASDSFIMPKMQMYRKIQRIDKSKYEVHLNVDYDKAISTASFNLHGKAFTDPFNISVRGEKNTVTACVGYGLQRWVIAFFSQFGFDVEKWPSEIAKEYISKERIVK